MIALVLSYFDLKTGPSILVSAPESFNGQILIEIPKLLDVYDTGFSIQIFESFKSANLQFRIESKIARGGEENLLLSIITDNKYYLNPNIAEELLIEIENEIRELKDAYLAFHSKYDELYKKNVIKIRKIIYKYYDSIQSTIRTLERAEIRYQTLFKSARDAIFLINKRSSEIIDLNQEGTCLLQKRREDLIGKKFDEVFKIDSKDSLFNQIITHSETNQLDHISTFLINQTSHKIGVEINTSIVKIGNEFIIQCIIRNISKRLEAEEKLKLSEEKYRLIIENAFDLITVVDMDLKHLFINESRYKEKLGYTREDLIGNSVLKYIHPEDIQKVIKNRDIGLETGKTEGAIIRIKKKDGGWLWFETRSGIFSDNNNNLKAVIISRDITEKINKNQIQKDSQNIINRFQQLLTFDIYNILETIKNSLKKLEASKQDPRKNINEIEVIKTQLNRGFSLLSKQEDLISN